MQLFKSPFSILLITFYLLNPNIIHSKEKSIHECFKKNNFTCGDPYSFLHNAGIDINKDIIRLSDLQLFRKKTTNNLKGVYTDSNKKTIYYIKQSNPVTELMGSRLMNLILGTRCTPIVKLVNDQKFTVASLELLNFKTQKKIDVVNKTIVGEAALVIAMDFIGLVDRHSRNMGYVALDPKTFLAARVDFDASFDFESNFFGEHSLYTNHLNLKHLYSSINKYPRNEIINAMKKIINIPDEKIVMVIFQSWATLTHAGYILDLNLCLAFAQQLIERKNAFREAFNEKNSIFNQLIRKKQMVQKKTKKPINKKLNKKKH